MSSTAGTVFECRGLSPTGNVARRLVAAISTALQALIVGLVVVLVVRRLSGAFHVPLGGLAIIAVAAIAELASIAGRASMLGTQYTVLGTEPVMMRAFGRQWPLMQLGWHLAGVLAAATLLSLTIPQTPVWGLVFAWILLIDGEVMQTMFYIRPRFIRGSWPFFASAFTVTRRQVETESAEVPEGLVQQVTRVVEGQRESIHALVQAQVAANDRLAVVHLAFCPPLVALPELTAHALESDTAEVRITQAETFGARIEVRLPDLQDVPRQVKVEVLGCVVLRPAGVTLPPAA